MMPIMPSKYSIFSSPVCARPHPDSATLHALELAGERVRGDQARQVG